MINKTICFVCNGNNSRSVMAEMIARNIWKDMVEVISCGINASEEKDIGLHTCMVLEEVGISIGDKKRNKISEKHLDENIIYYAMDNNVRNVLINDYGINEEKIQLFDPELKDPKDCEIDVYRTCRDRIEMVIREIDLEEVIRRTN